MSDTVVVALIALIVPSAGLIGAALRWMYGLVKTNAELEAENALYRELMPEATEVLKRSASAMRRQARPVPFISMTRKAPPSAPRSGRRR